MTGHVTRSRAALRDLDEAADDIRRHGSPERAVRFLRDADRTFAKLAGMPGIGTLHEADDPAFADVRVSPLSRFKKYLVFYRPVAGGIEILRVLHGARDIPSLLADELGLAGEADEEEAEGQGRG